MNQEIQLSSKWNSFGLYLGTFLLIFVTLAIILASKDEKLHIGIVLSAILYVVIVAFIIYLFVYNCKATLKENKLVLKKQFRQAKTYNINQIRHISSFRIKNTQYVTFEMKNHDSTFEKFLIMDHLSNKINVEATLRSFCK